MAITRKRPRSRQHFGKYSNATTEQKVAALLSFRRSKFFEHVMAFLEEQSYAGQNPFDAAGYDPYKAAAIGGRQDLLTTLEIEIEKAEKWKNKEQKPKDRLQIT